MDKKVWVISLSLLAWAALVMVLGFYYQDTSNKVIRTTPTENRKTVNATPIISKSDLVGIWTEDDGTNVRVGYLYFSANEVYYMAKKDGAPSVSGFTSDYRIASSYSVSVNDVGDTICSFGNWTATIYSKRSIDVSGNTISGIYKK